MAKAARAIPSAKKAPAKRRARKPKAVKAEPWRRLVFGDLHVDAEKLDRCMRVLDSVGELAEAHDATPVCTGDFWNIRGHWMVRHVDAVQQRIEAWRPAIFIPGNHDQVSLDGMVHGLNIFGMLEHHTVATERYIDEATRSAFLPWRELPEAQREMFDLEGEDWTIFAHATAGGAVTNGGHRAPGIIQVEDIERVSRACYLGHYHKRQKLGEHTWYIGSPFMQSMAERDDPHGVALITSDNPEPEFIELKGFPRYWRLDLHGDWDENEISEDDIVELVAPKDEIGTEDFDEIRRQIPATDVRTVPLKPPVDPKAPEFALTLDAAIEQQAEIMHAEEDMHSGQNVVDLETLVATGREVLGLVPEARAIPPLGVNVVARALRTENFCVLRGTLDIDLSTLKRAFIKAPIRTGKTAMLDAPMWCLYGETTPRKAGSSGSSLRADAVINDDAASCSVEMDFEVDGKPVTIRREKQRGSGSKVTITGIDYPDGISDQDQLVRHVVGYSHPIWRACVSMGQGAVANFATDADKARKLLLNSVFGLEACPGSAKKARQLANEAKLVVGQAVSGVTAAKAAKDALVGQDFAQQEADWEARRTASVTALQAASAAALVSATECTDLLKGEAAWLTTKGQHDAHIVAQTSKLAALRPTVRIAELQRQYGMAEGEKAAADREVTQAAEHYAQMVTAASEGAAACPSCGQALPDDQREQHMLAAEQRTRTAQAQQTTAVSRVNNIAVELDALNTGGDQEQKAVEQTIAESRTALEQCGTAISQFVRIRANMEAAQGQQAEADRRVTEEQAAPNPFVAQARQCAEQIAAYQAQEDEHVNAGAAAEANVARYEAWVEGFGPKGIPVLVLRTALFDLESAANRYLSELLAGTVYCQLSMEGDDLKIKYFETTPDGVVRERVYEQLSGGQRRCVEMSFAPFALSDMIFARCGVHVSLLMIDELTTHLGPDEKPRVCALLERLDRETILVVDHDIEVRGHFDQQLALVRGPNSSSLEQI